MTREQIEGRNTIANGVLRGASILLLIQVPAAAIGAFFGGVVGRGNCGYRASALECAQYMEIGTYVGVLIGLIIAAMFIVASQPSFKSIANEQRKPR